jgi:hypothetical protein
VAAVPSGVSHHRKIKKTTTILSVCVSCFLVYLTALTEMRQLVSKERAISTNGFGRMWKEAFIGQFKASSHNFPTE